MYDLVTFHHHVNTIVMQGYWQYGCRQWRWNEFESGGHWSVVKVRGGEHQKNFLVVPLQFLALQAQVVILVSAFVMVSTVWLVSCLLFYSPFPLPRAQLL